MSLPERERPYFCMSTAAIEQADYQLRMLPQSCALCSHSMAEDAVALLTPLYCRLLDSHVDNGATCRHFTVRSDLAQ